MNTFDTKLHNREFCFNNGERLTVFDITDVAEEGGKKRYNTKSGQDYVILDRHLNYTRIWVKGA